MARVEEAKPWDQTNTDGSPNRGAYRTGVSVGAVTVARRIAPGRWREVANKLVRLADAAQAEIRHDGGVNRQAKSHVYATKVVFSVALQLELDPNDDLSEWAFRVAVEARDMLHYAMCLDDDASLGGDLSSRIETKTATDLAAA